jgi:hypothetical protein
MAMIIVYAFSGPLLEYVSAPELHFLGILVGLIVYSGHWASIYRGDWDAKVMLFVAVVLLVITAVIYAPIISSAINDDAANDRRCLVIQRDMLSAKPRRDDGPDVFQALGCRPQGDGIVRAKPTDRERQARRALPDGGYSNR